LVIALLATQQLTIRKQAVNRPLGEIRMSTKNNIVRFLLATLFGAFALPATADNKVFAIDASASVASGAGKTITIVFNNLASGNSSFNSITLTANASSGSLIITDATTGGGKKGTLTGTGTNSIQITGLSPTQNGSSLTVTLTVTAAANGCSSGNVSWTADAWTGSPGTPSNHFVLQPTPGNRTTSIPAACSYTFAATPASVAAGATTQMTATIKNTSVAGPAISSFTLGAPAGVKITGVSGPSGTVGYSGQTITASGVSVASGSSYPVTVTVAPDASCTATAAAAWTSQVNAGAFGLSGSNPTTGITAQACGMSIVPPTSAAATVPFTVTVNLISGPGGANVTLTSSCGFTGAGTSAATGASATFSGTVANPGACTFNASADKGYPSAPPFTGFTVYGGVLGCASGENFVGDPALDPDLDGPFVGTPGHGLRRGPNLDDLTGANCVKVNFNFTFDPSNNSSSLLYDKAAGPPPQKAQFEYVLLWNAVPIEASGYPTARPMVSWGIANPSYPADYVPALACPEDDYVTLGSAVMPTIPATPPFNDGTYPAGTYPQYQPGQPAKMCVAQEGWTSVGGGLLQHWSKIIDQSDGYVRLP
jgi:hypothetical protein